MKTTIISGSQRENSQSLKVSKYLNNQWQKNFGQSEIIELAKLNLPFWSSTPDCESAWESIRKK